MRQKNVFKKTVFVLLLCLAGTTVSFAQKGGEDFVITTQGDSLSGKITKRKATQITIRRPDGKQKLTTKEVRKYYLEKSNKTYLSLITSESRRDDPVFLLLLIDGDLQLLEDDNQKGGAPMMTGGGLAMGGGPMMMGGGYTPKKFYARKGTSSYAVAIRDNNLFSKVTRASGKRELIQLISDNKALAEQLTKEKRFSKSVLEDYIKAYNLQKKYDNPLE